MPKSVVSPTLSPIAVSVGQALLVAGILPADHDPGCAERTALQQIARGVYPFPLVRLPNRLQRRYVVRLVDIEATLRRLAGQDDAETGAHPNERVVAMGSRRPPGRPRLGMVRQGG